MATRNLPAADDHATAAGPTTREDRDDAPLFGPGGRIPAIDAITVPRRSALRSLRQGWAARHSVAMAVASPLLFVVYSAAVGAGPGALLRFLLAGTLAVTAALILTTYLPLRGAQRAAGAPCGAMAGLLVPGTILLLNQNPGALSGVLALSLLGLGLWQRVSGASTCA